MQGNYKLYYSEGNYKLYDIEKDPFEMKNIADQLPDMVIRLKQILLGQLKKYEDSFSGNEYGRESYDKVIQNWWDITKQ